MAASNQNSISSPDDGATPAAPSLIVQFVALEKLPFLSASHLCVSDNPVTVADIARAARRKLYAPPPPYGFCWFCSFSFLLVVWFVKVS